FKFAVTNNKAEYEALLAGLKLALKARVASVRVFSDSQLIVNHVNGDYEAKGTNMIKYLKKVKELIGFFRKFTITRIPREENALVDALSKMINGQTTVPGVIFHTPEE